MNKNTQANFEAALFALGLEKTPNAPLHRQLADALRDMILSGLAPVGAQLPPSRRLAQELSVSRMTTQAALDQLAAEGYLESRQGAGVFVAQDIPHLAPPVSVAEDPAPESQPYAVFHPGVADLSLFPYAKWARYLDRSWRRPDPALLHQADPFGYWPLRQAIADHLKAWRGIEAGAAQVVITSGASDGFDLIARACFAEGGAVHVEDPCFSPMRRALESAGLATHPVPVDGDGFDVAQATESAIGCVVTPSRHYPLGVTLSLPRRLALLEWAKRQDRLILEDDYDGEFRYRGQPLPAMASLDREGHVIYMGSFSKLLSPSLRIAYLVVPKRNVTQLEHVAHKSGLTASLTPQPALAAFMQDGEFAIHLRRMRRIYAARQNVLVEALQAKFPDQILCQPEPGGMHLTCQIGPALKRVTDIDIAAVAQEEGLGLRALSAYSSVTNTRQGLVLGYAGFEEAQLLQGVERLAAALKNLG